MEMTEENLRELAAQLGKPQGNIGNEVAKNMIETNIGMIRHSIGSLSVQSGNKILEIGHGNGEHLKQLLDSDPSLLYYGLEISDLMHQHARSVNQEFVEQKRAEFIQYDGNTLPFEEAFFDRIFSVNTIYFWKKPEEFMQELYRVLKPGGILCLTFALKDFMQKLPFVQYGFQLYNIQDVEALAKVAGFSDIDALTQTETVTSKAGELVERDFSTFRLTK